MTPMEQEARAEKAFWADVERARTLAGLERSACTEKMLHSTKRSFFARSRVTLGGSGEYANQLAAIVKYSKKKDRWVCELLNARFASKRVLVRDDGVAAFEGWSASSVELDEPAHLEVASAGAAGRALVVKSAAAAGMPVLLISTGSCSCYTV